MAVEGLLEVFHKGYNGMSKKGLGECFALGSGHDKQDVKFAD